MGLFSTRRVVSVGSSVWNLAGDIDDRPNVLKKTIIAGIIGKTPNLPEHLLASMIRGQGIRLQRFVNWYPEHYADVIGFSAGSLVSGHSLNTTTLAGEIPVSVVGHTIFVEASDIGDADYSYWADQYIAENYPTQLNTEYSVNMNEETNVITITFVDTTTVSFTPTDFDASADYLYATYTENIPGSTGAVVVGATTTLGIGDIFPTTAGWTIVSETTVGSNFFGIYSKVENIPPNGGSNALSYRTSTMYQNIVATVSTWRVDTQDSTYKTWGAPQIFIYKKNSGNAVLDLMFNAPSNIGNFFPFIPFRIKNKDVQEHYPDLYESAAKAFKKATNGEYDDVRASILDNPSINDLDYVHAVFGVSLNTKEQAGRKYIYRFFEKMMEDPNRQTYADYSAWEAAWNIADASLSTWVAWYNVKQVDPFYAVPEPEIIPYPTAEPNSLRIKSTDTLYRYDITIDWASIEETTGTGSILVGDNTVGDLWFTIGADITFSERRYGVDPDTETFGLVITKSKVLNTIYLNWQVTPTTWKKLTIIGLTHNNFTFRGKSVFTTSKDALNKVPTANDPGESGFIIPLHEDIFRAISLVDRTQLGTSCCYLLFNYYESRKQKWYETSFFKFLVLVAAIVITIYFPPFGANGVFGSSATIGSNLGITNGALAYAVGATANFIGSIVIIRAAQEVATAIWGKEVGIIVGTIVGVIAVQGITGSYAQGATLTTSFGDMMNAKNLMMLMTSTGNAYGNYLQAAAADTQQKIESFQQEYASEMEEINQKFKDLMGDMSSLLDPTELMSIFSATDETSASFLQRTLMVGTDIANLSINMLNNYTGITLSTDLPIVT